MVLKANQLSSISSARQYGPRFLVLRIGLDFHPPEYFLAAVAEEHRFAMWDLPCPKV
jgi:hypothetical protein